MNLESDDEMYRVDAVWLGPPNVTMPWRARYVSWAVGLVTALLTLGVLRIWFDFGFFTVAWALLIAVGVTRLIGKKITHDRPLGDVARMALRELNTPRPATTPTRGTASPAAVRARPPRPTTDRRTRGRRRPGV